MIPDSKAFMLKLSELLQNARSQKLAFIDISSGNLHQWAGGYPPKKGEQHAMPSCCQVMRKMMGNDDKILCEPPSGQGTNLVIRYYLR